MSAHTLDDCPLSEAYLDECDLCGPLIVCTCLDSLVQDYEIASTGAPGVFAFRYEYRRYTSDLVGYFGYAETYREAMNAIAHAVSC